MADPRRRGATKDRKQDASRWVAIWYRPLETYAMNESLNRSERFTVEGFFEGDWHLVMSSNERETAIRGAGSVVVSGALEFVRIMLNGVVPGTSRESVRIDQKGTVRNGAFVEDIAEPIIATPQESVEPQSQTRTNALRPAAGVAAAMVLFATGILLGNWAIQII